MLLAVLTAGLFPNLAVKRVGRNSKQMEVQGGKVDAAAHMSTAYGNSRFQGDVISSDEYSIYEELLQVESSYSLKTMSLVHPALVFLLGGEEHVELGGNVGQFSCQFHSYHEGR